MRDEKLQALRDKIKVELELKAIEQQRLDELRRLREAEQDRMRIIEMGLGQYANLAEQVNVLLAAWQSSLSIEDALREWFANLAERIERIEEILLLTLASRSKDQAGVAEARRALESERRESLKRQLKIHYRNLQNLEEQAAALGQHPPVEKLNAIEFARVSIERLEFLLGEDPP